LKKRIEYLKNFYKFKIVSQIADTRLNWSPGIALDQERNIYVSCQSSNIIAKYDKELNFVSQWGSFGEKNGQFNNPVGIDFFDNKVYVVDKKNKRIQVFDTNGNLLNIIDKNLNKKLCFDGIGHVVVTNDQHMFIVNYIMNLVYVLDIKFELKRVFELNKINDGIKYKISSIICDEFRKSVYVGIRNGRIFKLSIDDGIKEMLNFNIEQFSITGMTDFYYHNDCLFFKDTHKDSLYKLSKDGKYFKWKNKYNSLVKIIIVKPNLLYMSLGTCGIVPGEIKIFEI